MNPNVLVKIKFSSVNWAPADIVSLSTEWAEFTDSRAGGQFSRGKGAVE